MRFLKEFFVALVELLYMSLFIQVSLAYLCTIQINATYGSLDTKWYPAGEMRHALFLRYPVVK